MSFQNPARSRWRKFIEAIDYRPIIPFLLATLFIFVNAASLSLIRTGEITRDYITQPLIWLVTMLTAFIVLRTQKPKSDTLLFLIYAFLTGWGLVLQARLAPNFIWRQVLWVVLGTAVLLLITTAPRNLNWLSKYPFTWLAGGIFLLIFTLIFGVNPIGFGAALWLKVPVLTDIYFQPSELLKLLLIIFLASFFAERGQLLRLGGRRGRLAALPYFAPLLLMWGFCIVLLVWQQDLGAAAQFFLLFLAILFLATGDKLFVLGGFLLLIIAGIIAYFAFDLVALRIEAWWNPWPDFDNRAFQIVQSLYALAAGGGWGNGIAQGFPQYIPVVHSDFVFAAIVEEWGLAGGLSIVVIFAMLVQRGLQIAQNATRQFSLYLAAGITVMLCTQALLILGGVTKLLPLTGVTLPFVSYGGSAMLINSGMLGFLLYLSADKGN